MPADGSGVCSAPTHPHVHNLAARIGSGRRTHYLASFTDLPDATEAAGGVLFALKPPVFIDFKKSEAIWQPISL